MQHYMHMANGGGRNIREASSINMIGCTGVVNKGPSVIIVLGGLCIITRAQIQIDV